MFAELLTYDPTDLDPDLRAQIAGVIQVRAELLTLQGEVASLRARVWFGEEGLDDLIGLRSANLMKLREDMSNKIRPLFKNAVNVDDLLELLPSIGLALMQTLNVPLPVLLEALGVDIDAIMLMVKEFKKLTSE